jgi:His-Xaa-Ser system protein HxsD
MNIVVDASENRVTVTVPLKLYSEDAVRIAAHVFDGRAEVYHDAGRTARELTLAARRKGLDAAALEALGGEFLNELLNQEYRFIVARFNRRVADRIVAQTLLSARGGDNPPKPPADSAELKAETKRLLAEAADEIRRTMPKRIAPQGAPMRPPQEPDGR